MKSVVKTVGILVLMFFLTPSSSRASLYKTRKECDAKYGTPVLSRGGYRVYKVGTHKTGSYMVQVNFEGNHAVSMGFSKYVGTKPGAVPLTYDECAAFMKTQNYPTWKSQGLVWVAIVDKTTCLAAYKGNKNGGMFILGTSRWWDEKNKNLDKR